MGGNLLNIFGKNKNMEKEILRKIEEQEEKIEKIYVSVEKTRKYFLWTLIITIVVVVLPILLMIVAVPKLFSVYSEMLQLYNF